MTFTHALSTNNYGPAAFIVDSNAANGTHVTVQTAITAAVSGQTIFIRPGTYTENLTLKAGVNLTAYTCDGSSNGSNNVIIIGKCTFTAAGTANISGIQLQTNSDFLIANTGSAASILNLNNCYLNCSNNTGITFTSSSSSARVNLSSCQGNLGTTGIAYFASSSTGILNFNMCTLNNSGGSSTANTVSAGAVSFFACGIANPTTTSSTGGVTVQYCNYDTSGTNSITITHGGSGNGFVFFSFLASGTAAAISVGTGSTVAVIKCDINSTNTNPITGAGTANFDSVAFSNTGTGINSTTKGYFPNLLGTPGSTAPTAGFIGEQIRATVTQASAVTLTTTNNANVTSIALTPGIWDVSGIIMFNGTVTGTIYQANIVTTTAASGTKGDNMVEGTAATSPTAVADTTLTIPAFRISLAANTSAFLVAAAAFTVGTCKAYGRISATRVG